MLSEGRPPAAFGARDEDGLRDIEGTVTGEVCVARFCALVSTLSASAGGGARVGSGGAAGLPGLLTGVDP